MPDHDRTRGSFGSARTAASLLAMALVLPAAIAPTAARASEPVAMAVPEGPPVIAPANVTDEHWGVRVADPYRALENMDDPATQAWFKAQGAYARATLDKIPGRAELLERLKEFDAGRPYKVFDITRLAGGQVFYLKLMAQANLATLCVRDGLEGKERVLFDPSTLKAADGGHVSIGFYTPSPDGKRVLYGLAPSGSEETTLHILDVATGKDLPETIDRLEDAYTPPLWVADGGSFVYSRRRLLPADAPETEGYKLSRAYVHRLGTPVDQDPVVFAKDLWPNVAMSDVDFPSLVLLPGVPFAIGKIKHGDSNQLTLYAAPLATADDLVPRAGKASPWRMVCDVADSVNSFAAQGRWIDLMTSRDAPRFKVVRTGLAAPDFAQAKTIVEPGPDVVLDLAAAKDALYVEFAHGGASRIERIGYADGARRERLPMPDEYASVGILSGDPAVPGVIASGSSWTRGGRTYAFVPEVGTFVDTKLNPLGKYDQVPGYTSIEVEVPSHDGVMVPLSIVYKKGIKLDGTNPTLLYGYGAYGSSMYVSFSASRLAWLEKGGVFAMAHVRGGGENGQEWHLAGQKLTKPNTWKDFIACAEFLIKEGYTSPARLAGQGGSAGGILMGRALTERPDLFAAAVVDVGSVDTIRMELTRNGVPNIPEFGTVTKEDEFRGLLEMSAYHHVKEGTEYPAVLLTAGMHDPRVEPWESAKMTARLQAATTSGKPVLFRVDTGAGHGIGSTKSQLLETVADRYSFLLWQMNVPGYLP